MTTIRILLAEDHEIVRQGLKLLIDAQGDMEVVGEAPDGPLAVERAHCLKPHVIVLDVSMPGMNGLAVARAIKNVEPPVAIVAFTRHSDEAYVQELVAAGALAYVLKQSPSAELLRAIRGAAAGKRYLDPMLAARTDRPLARAETPRKPAISDREAEVLHLMAVGHTNKEIAAQLALSLRTVEAHKANAARKLGFRGRIDFIRYAVLQGWLREP